MNHKACPRCGLIQMYDILWGLQICDAKQTIFLGCLQIFDTKEALFMGCPSKDLVLQIIPNAQYDESIIPIQKYAFLYLLGPVSSIIRPNCF